MCPIQCLKQCFGWVTSMWLFVSLYVWGYLSQTLINVHKFHPKKVVIEWWGNCLFHMFFQSDFFIAVNCEGCCNRISLILRRNSFAPVLWPQSLIDVGAWHHIRLYWPFSAVRACVTALVMLSISTGDVCAATCITFYKFLCVIVMFAGQKLMIGYCIVHE